MDSPLPDRLTDRPPRRYWKLVAVLATVGVFCLLGTLIDSSRWGIFRRPGYAERAAQFRAEAAEWERLAAENPGRAKSFLKTSVEARETAERLERRAAKTAKR